MSVKLREKQLKNGNLSLYLDIYHNGKRNYEFLKIHIIKPARTPVDRQHNKEAKELASQIRSKRELEMQATGYDQTAAFKRKVNFLEFARKIADEKKESSRRAYYLVIRKIEAYTGSDTLPFEHINKQWCDTFYRHLLDNVSINSAYDQFNKFSHFLTMAVKREVILRNSADKVERKKREDTKREYLTFEEVQRLVETPCQRKNLKKAFLFSCLTGLRWSDAKALAWGAIQHSEQLGYYIDHQQIKTQSYENLPVSDQAISLLGEPGKPSDKVFVLGEYTTVMMQDLKMWAIQAGITKPITFHVSRHTFATLQLTNGTDIAVVSKLLGHKDISVTQQYARVIDLRRREAVDNMPKLKMGGEG